VKSRPAEANGITLVYSIDENNVNAMLVSLSSVLENARSELQVRVLYTGKHPGRLNRLMEKVCGSTPFRVFDTSKDFCRVKRAKFPAGTVSKISYLKFLVPDFVETRRAIYLDADTIVRADLQDLHEHDLREHPIGAVQDWLVQTVLSEDSPIHHYVRSKVDLPYFNAGVMLMDVARLREMDLMEEAARFRDLKTRYVDQDIFNLIFLGNWSALDPFWNFPADQTLLNNGSHTLHGELWMDRKIVHYLGTKKPWVFPFNLRAINQDFSECRNRSRLKYWIANPLSPSSLRYYVGFVRRKFGAEY
jgi:lipopolysaccharide biosynthesis glycosyltransferase